MRAHLAQNEQLQELPPAAVKLYGRHLAYAAGFGLADHAVTALPFGEEDDHLAWSPQGGRWRRVRVRYPRVRPPAWGRHPALATLLGLVVGRSARASCSCSWPAPAAMARCSSAPCSPFPLLWSIWVLVRAVPDLFTTRTITGTVLRCRTRPQMLVVPQRAEVLVLRRRRRRHPRPDRRYRVPEDRYRSVRQGQTVTADVTPRLGYVRDAQMRRSSFL